MPANPKHLEKSNWQRFAKISAGLLGGYILSFLVHAFLLLWYNRETVIETAKYGIFVLWMPLLILPFLFKNGWYCWLLYLGIGLFLFTILHLS